jgi:hypothetical protein
MAESVALWGRDIDESSADLDVTHVSDGPRDPITEPIPVFSRVSGGYDGQFEEAVAYAEPVIDRRPSAGSTLTFKPAPVPWYRTKRGLIVLIAAIAVAAVLAIVPMLLRTPGPGSEEPTNVTPTTGPAPSSAQPTTAGSLAPTLTSQPASPPTPPPPPPAAPPPPAQDAPVYTRQYPAPGGSAPKADEPQIGVTRAPISVAPKPVTPPSTAEVGVDGGNGNWRRRW